MSDARQPPQRSDGAGEFIPKGNGDGDEPSRDLMVASSFSGPLPPPDLLREYEEILPGAAERIFAMTEQLAAAKAQDPALAKLAIETLAADVRRSHWMAFGSVVLSFAAVFVAMHLGYPRVASVIASTTVVGLVVAFIGGRFLESRQRARDLDDDETA